MNTATQSRVLIKTEPRQQTPPKVIPARPETANNTTNASANNVSSNPDPRAFMAVVQQIFLQYQQQKTGQQPSRGPLDASANGTSSNPDLQAFMAVAQRIFLQYHQHRMRQQSSGSQVSETANQQNQERANGHQTEPRQQAPPRVDPARLWGQQPQTTSTSTNNTNSSDISSNGVSSDLALRALQTMQLALRGMQVGWRSLGGQVSQAAGRQSSERVNGQAPVPAPTLTPAPALSTATYASPPTTTVRAPALSPAPSRLPLPASGPAPACRRALAPVAPAPVHAAARARAPAKAPGRLRPYPNNTRNSISASLDSGADQMRSRRQARARRQAMRRAREATQHGEGP